MAISPILGIDSDALPDKVLVVGDPGRVEKVGEHLTGLEWLGRNREYHSLIGYGHDPTFACHCCAVNCTKTAVLDCSDRI